MQDEIPQQRIDQMAVTFMADHAGMGRDDLSALLGMTHSEIMEVMNGKAAAPAHSQRAIRGLVAIQSLLLSGYSPAGAGAWMKSPCPQISGRIPCDVFASGDPAAIAIVLRAAYDRMAS